VLGRGIAVLKGYETMHSGGLTRLRGFKANLQTTGVCDNTRKRFARNGLTGRGGEGVGGQSFELSSPNHYFRLYITTAKEP
jgi:hypothetical protein